MIAKQIEECNRILLASRLSQGRRAGEPSRFGKISRAPLDTSAPSFHNHSFEIVGAVKVS